jgi:hypothetical protein
MQHGPFALPTIQYSKPHHGQDMLFNIPFIADWKKVGEHRQKLTDLNTAQENKGGMIIRLVKKYLYGTMVYSAKQNPSI